LEASVEASLAPLLGLRHHPPAPTRGGPGMTQLREDRTERLRAIDRAYSG
jgi:hypothetical protein